MRIHQVRENRIVDNILPTSAIAGRGSIVSNPECMPHPIDSKQELPTKSMLIGINPIKLNQKANKKNKNKNKKIYHPQLRTLNETQINPKQNIKTLLNSADRSVPSVFSSLEASL